MATIELSCKELVEIITDYLDGALSPADRWQFEAHIAACADCTRYLDQIRETIRLTGGLAEEQIAPDARTELLSIFKNWKSNQG